MPDVPEVPVEPVTPDIVTVPPVLFVKVIKPDVELYVPPVIV